MQHKGVDRNRERRTPVLFGHGLGQVCHIDVWSSTGEERQFKKKNGYYNIVHFKNTFYLLFRSTPDRPVNSGLFGADVTCLTISRHFSLLVDFLDWTINYRFYLIGSPYGWPPSKSSALYYTLHDKMLNGVNIPSWNVTEQFQAIADWCRVLGVWRSLNKTLSTISQVFSSSTTFPERQSKRKSLQISYNNNKFSRWRALNRLCIRLEIFGHIMACSS